MTSPEKECGVTFDAEANVLSGHLPEEHVDLEKGCDVPLLPKRGVPKRVRSVMYWSLAGFSAVLLFVVLTTVLRQSGAVGHLFLPMSWYGKQLAAPSARDPEKGICNWAVVDFLIY